MKKLALCICLVITAHCWAQLPQCYVNTVTGVATVLRGEKAVVLKKGDFIFKVDTITVKNASSLTLIDYDNKFIVIDKAGKFTYKDLQKNMDAKPTGITESFLKFVWEDLFKPGTAGTLISSASIGGVTGGASRGGCDLSGQPLSGSKIGDDTIHFSWSRVITAQSYRFTLQASSRNDIINIIIHDTSLALLKKDLMQGDSVAYFWTVTPNINRNSQCEQPATFFTLKSLQSKQNDIKSVIENAGKNDDGFVYNLKIANVLALNGWYKEAFEYYLKAKESLRK